MIFNKKNRELLDRINDYLNVSGSLMNTFVETIKSFLKEGQGNAFCSNIRKVQKMEAEADDILHIIETLLYKKSLLPESREDLMRLLENHDDIIDCSYHILRFIETRNIKVPDLIKNDISEMTFLSLKCYEFVPKAIHELLGKRENITGYIRFINRYESDCDRIETESIKKIFMSGINDFEKLIFSELLTNLTHITDSCEDAADYVTLMNLKRTV